MTRSRAVPALLGAALFVFASVAGAQYALPPRMLPIPVFPVFGEPTFLSVVDPATAFPGSGPFLYVREADPPARLVASGGIRFATPTPLLPAFTDVHLNLGTLPAGKYRAEYFDLPAAPGPGDIPKLSIEFFVSLGGPVKVVEYYNPALDHYFLTADAGEMARLDSGLTRGWQRTGEFFRALPSDQIPSYGRPVCRFYGLPEYGLDSHFYSATPDECVAVASKWPDRWQLETDNAFGTLVDVFPFDCSDTMRHVYRLFNNRPDVNHRYTTSSAIRDQMIAKGWILEAFDHFPWEEPYTMCVPM